MRHKKKLIVLLSLLVTLAVAIITTTAGLHTQNQNRSTSPAQKKAEEDFYTVTEVDKPEPSDPEKRRLRKIRRDRYKPEDKNADASRFAIDEESQSGYGLHPFHIEPEPAIPAAKSDVVLIGEVTEAEAFLATQNTAVFSEFTVNVSETLKNTTSEPLIHGASISAVRSGGTVRFPSGGVVRRGVDGKPLPRVGRAYLFFLERNEVGEDFTIITAYELRGGRVFPLDGIGVSGEPSFGREAYLKFNGVDETSFLITVKEAIAQSGGMPEKGGV